MKYCIDIYLNRPKLWLKKYGCKEKQSKEGRYYSVRVSEEEKKKITKKLKWRNIKYRCYETRWDRSSDYRKKFFENNEPPYRCRYCNRRLKKDYVIVDHIVPVNKVKKNANNSRFILGMQGIKTVNDPKNLVASCFKCNNAKRDKMGIWLIKAWLGKYSLYWKVKPFVEFVVISVIIHYILSSGALGEFLNLLK